MATYKGAKFSLLSMARIDNLGDAFVERARVSCYRGSSEAAAAGIRERQGRRAVTESRHGAETRRSRDNAHCKESRQTLKKFTGEP